MEQERVDAPGLPLLEGASAALTLGRRRAPARQRAGAARRRCAAGGAGRGGRGGAAARLSLEATLAGAAIAGPLFGGLPLDLAAGKADARAALSAAGHSTAALLATLDGTLAFGLRGGILNGYDLGAVQAASAVPDLAEAEAALRRALAGGATSTSAWKGRRAWWTGARPSTAPRSRQRAARWLPPPAAWIFGRGGALDLRFATRPVAEAPEIGLRLAGPAAGPAAPARDRAFPALAGRAVGGGPVPDGAPPYHLTALLSYKATCLVRVAFGQRAGVGQITPCGPAGPTFPEAGRSDKRRIRALTG